MYGNEVLYSQHYCRANVLGKVNINAEVLRLIYPTHFLQHNYQNGTSNNEKIWPLTSPTPQYLLSTHPLTNAH